MSGALTHRVGLLNGSRELVPLIPEALTTGSLIVAVGTGGAWDTNVREIGNIIYDPTDAGKEYKLLYSGHSGSYAEDAYIGYAYSSDGVTWTKSTVASPLIARKLEDPWVIKVGSTYYLYAEDKADTPFRNIRGYTSTDFVTWTDQGDILDIGSTWESVDVSSPVVWKDGATWHMLYEGRNGSANPGAIAHATSSDGLSWTKETSANPVFVADNATYGWSGVNWAQCVVGDDIKFSGGRVYFYFHGQKNGLSGPFDWECGVAVGTSIYNLEDTLDDYVTISGTHGAVMMLVPNTSPQKYVIAIDGVGIYLVSPKFPGNAAPSFSSAPVVTSSNGFYAIGDELSVTEGTHNGFAPLYQWTRDGEAIAGEIATTYTIDALDDGAIIACEVSVVGSGGETVGTSNLIGPVGDPVYTPHRIVPSGDMQSGTDAFLTSGDMQSGTDYFVTIERTA